MDKRFIYGGHITKFLVALLHRVELNKLLPASVQLQALLSSAGYF